MRCSRLTFLLLLLAIPATFFSWPAKVISVADGDTINDGSMKILSISFFLLLFVTVLNQQAAFADDYSRGGGRERWGDEARNEEYRDGPCEVKIESKRGEFKRVIKCKDGIGADWGGEWKKEYWDGNCKVKQEAKFDEFKEEIKCER